MSCAKPPSSPEDPVLPGFITLQLLILLGIQVLTVYLGFTLEQSAFTFISLLCIISVAYLGMRVIYVSYSQK